MVLCYAMTLCPIYYENHPSSRRVIPNTITYLFYIIQQFRCWGLLHFDVGKEFLSCIFETGPKEIYHIVNNQKAVVISLAEIDCDGWVLLVMSRYVKLLLI